MISREELALRRTEADRLLATVETRLAQGLRAQACRDFECFARELEVLLELDDDVDAVRALLSRARRVLHRPHEDALMCEGPLADLREAMRLHDHLDGKDPSRLDPRQSTPTL